jgi:light-harvesting complex 1 beta chain
MMDADDLVPPKWRMFFNNQDWIMHDIYVKSMFGFMIIAILAHLLCFIWRPWLGLPPVINVPVVTF